MRAFRSLTFFACLQLVAASLPAAAGGPPPLLIGAVLSTTGPFAPLGEPEANALRLAERDINAHGGAGGRPISIEIVDDEGKPDTAAQLATQFAGRGAVAIVGGTTSNTTAAIVRVTTAAKVLQIYPTPTAVFWDAKSGVAKTVFETTPRNELEAGVLLGFATNALHAAKLAILHDENTVGTAGATAFVAAMDRRGMQPVANESYPTATTDVTGQLARIKAAGADAIVLWGASPALGLITRQIRQLDPKLPIVSSTGTLSDNFLRIAGPAGDGTYSDSALNFTHPSAATARFLELYRAAYHKRAVQFASFAWDAAHLAARAIAIAHGKTDGESLAGALETMRPYRGSTAVYRFTAIDHNGMSAADIHIAVDRNGVWFTL
jgi:branched-chain amino acid transport system substrate-binding protein